MNMLFLYCVSLFYEIAGVTLASVCGACSVLAGEFTFALFAAKNEILHSAFLAGGFDYSLSAPRPA
jgi:hypothetical protein